MGKGKLTRREFVKGSVAAAALGFAGCARGPALLIQEPGSLPPGERLNIACIGCGGQGGRDIDGIRQENIVALCDVDGRRASETFKKFPGVRKFKDYRRMLETMDKEIDAVTVSVPDHSHYPAAMMAMAMGKHVFVQKPLTHTVWEARQLTLAARKYGVATQMGNQGHAKEGVRLFCEWIWAGAIGPVREVHIWTNRPIWPQGMDRPRWKMTPPATLDWDLWLGTAPYRPYHRGYAPFNWRGWWDFGTGALGDMACHTADAFFFALKPGAPVSVEAESSPVNGESAPEWSIVTFQFPARGEMPPVKLVWYDGKKTPPRPPELEADREMPESGQFWYGDDGIIMDTTDYCESPRIIPEAKMREFLPNRPDKSIPRVPESNHYLEWLTACKGGTPAGSNFDYAGPFTEAILLGNVAIRTGQKIEWDAANMRITNLPEANRLIHPPYREGWEMPGVIELA